MVTHGHADIFDEYLCPVAALPLAARICRPTVVFPSTTLGKSKYDSASLFLIKQHAAHLISLFKTTNHTISTHHHHRPLC